MTPPFPGLGASVGLVAAALALAAGLGAAGPWPLGVVNLLAFGSVGLAAAWWQRRGVAVRGDSAPEPEPKARWSAAAVAGLVLTAAGGGVVLGELGNQVARLWPVSEGLARALNHLLQTDRVEALVALAVIAPLTEEGLFRGVLLPSLARRHGPWVGVGLTALLFAASHLNPWQGLSALLAGVYLGWLRLRSGGLAMPIAAHALFNGLPLALLSAGAVLPGYNTPVAATPESVALPWLAAAVAALAVGVPLSLGLRLFRARDV